MVSDIFVLLPSGKKKFINELEIKICNMQISTLERHWNDLSQYTDKESGLI
jgi:hypothetical protein